MANDIPPKPFGPTPTKPIKKPIFFSKSAQDNGVISDLIKDVKKALETSTVVSKALKDIPKVNDADEEEDYDEYYYTIEEAPELGDNKFSLKKIFKKLGKVVKVVTKVVKIGSQIISVIKNDANIVPEDIPDVCKVCKRFRSVKCPVVCYAK
ncbi:hypothetical protein GPJ56_008089 [Histomonas meleagridis]|uniref:uncharacterized protein n=1 Tax=Histomonas meleagridis TaxID=135588 RepID=UPI0035595BC8|nr:hypothetical protein GPJ56_008089 [Histomonas meleagridis]KAH0798960.1 hypothetical protein GO595_008250 [Histomonas meleagridis]